MQEENFVNLFSQALPILKPQMSLSELNSRYFFFKSARINSRHFFPAIFYAVKVLIYLKCLSLKAGIEIIKENKVIISEVIC